MSSESEHDWLFEYVTSVLSSPSWEVPIMSFIDDNCILFGAEEENSLLQAEVHNKFKNLIEGLLEDHLNQVEVGRKLFEA